MSGPRGAGGDEAPSAPVEYPPPATTFRPPKGPELVEIYRLIHPSPIVPVMKNGKEKPTEVPKKPDEKTKQPEQMLHWLKKHPDVRADWVWDGTGELPGVVPAGSYPRGKTPPEGALLLTSPYLNPLKLFFMNSNFTFLAQAFIRVDTKLDDALVTEVLRRKPTQDLTPILTTIEAARPPPGSAARGTGLTETQKKVDYLREYPNAKKALVNLLKLQEVCAEKKLPPGLLGEEPKELPSDVQGACLAPKVTAGLANVDPKDPPEVQISKLRAFLRLDPEKKGGRRTRRRSQKRKTRRRQ